MIPRKLFCGIEGGATRSTCVICEASGVVLTEHFGPSTNQWLIGLDACAVRLTSLIDEACNALSEKHPDEWKDGDSVVVAAAGLMLSGVGGADEQDALERRLREMRPRRVEKYLLRNDTFAPLGLTPRACGIVIISGTGSNCRGLTSDGATRTCGGWGHLLGDEGSAYSISMAVLREIFRRHDCYGGTVWEDDASTLRVTAAIAEHFELGSYENLQGMLALLYRDFSKDKIASLCPLLAELARAAGDPLCTEVFRNAGVEIADMIRGVLTSLPELASSSPLSSPFKSTVDAVSDIPPLPVICVGSVWNSVDLFEGALRSRLLQSPATPPLVFMKITNSCAVGAAHLSAMLCFGERFVGIDPSANLAEIFKV